MQTLTATIPFAGFYESHHSDELDYAVESMFSNDDGEPNRGLTDRVIAACHWPGVHLGYAKEFAANYCERAGIDQAQFDSMDSPAFYNFETDRLFVELPLSEVTRMMRATSTETMNKVARKRHSSRDGFISFYSPVWSTWGDVSRWDHNQLQTLIEAYVIDDDGGLEEIYLMETARDNGRLEERIAENTPEIERLYRIYDYLRAREARK